GRASGAARSWPARAPTVRAESGQSYNLRSLFRPWAVASLHETQSEHPLRAQSDVSLPKWRRTRERGARECRAIGLSRARALTRTVHAKRDSAYAKRAASRRQGCSRTESKALARLPTRGSV